GDVAQERHDVLGGLGSAERHDHEGVIGLVGVGVHASIMPGRAPRRGAVLEPGAVRTVVIYESLTGNTRHVADLIAAELRAAGGEATVSPIDRVDLAALAKADLVVVGSWVDGM